MYNILPSVFRKRHITFMYNHLRFVSIFALLYWLAHNIMQDAYQYDRPREEYRLWDFIYFSLVTQSTVGFGDMKPTNWLTKLLVCLQLLSVVGIIVVSVV